MEDENQESFLLSDDSKETLQSTDVMSTACTGQTITLSTAPEKTLDTTPSKSDLTMVQASPSSEQPSQTVYLAMGPGGQLVPILASNVLQAQSQPLGSSQEGSIMSQLDATSSFASSLITNPSLPPVSISDEVCSPIFLSVNVPLDHSSVLLQHHDVSPTHLGPSQKGKRPTRRSLSTAQRGASSSKQTVRSLLQHKPTMPSQSDTDVAPNVTVLSRDPTLSESLRLSAAGSSGVEDTKHPSLLSLLRHKVPKQGIEVQGVAVRDLEKILASRTPVTHSELRLTGRKKPRILSGKHTPGTHASKKSLVPILPAPLPTNISVTESMLTVPAQLQHGQQLQSSQEPINIVPQPQALGTLSVADGSQWIVQSSGLLPLSTEHEVNKQLLDGSQVQLVQTVADNTPLASQETLLLTPEATALPAEANSDPTLDLHQMQDEDPATYTATVEDTFIAGQTLTLVEHDRSRHLVETATQTEESSTSIVAPTSGAELMSSQSLQRRICQVFSEIRATVSQALLDSLPGAESISLQDLAMDNNLSVSESTDHMMSVRGDLHDMVAMHAACLNILVEGATDKCKDFTEKEPVLKDVPESVGEVETVTHDKEIMCDLLKPQYSRSGRQLKWQTIDTRFEDEAEPAREHKLKRTSRSSSKKSKMISSSKPKKSKNKKRDSDFSAKEVNSTASDDTEKLKEESGEKTADVAVILPTAAAESEKVVAIKTGEETEDVEDAGTAAEAESLEESVETVTAGKDSEKENEDGQVTGTKTEELENSLGSDTVKVLKSTEGILLGRSQKRKKNYEKESPYKFFCTKCSFKTKRFSHYEKHLEYHREEIPLLQCSKCDFTTIRRSHLTKHQQVHSKVQFECPVCKYKSDSRTLLTRHYKAKHRPENTKRKDVTLFSCPHCSYKTLRLYLYNRHLKCHSSLEEDSTEKLVTTYQCEICPYKTQRKEHYCRHMANVHEKKRPHLCDLCGKAFKRKDALQQHRVMHLDKNSRKYPFQCPECLKSFAARGHLKDHMTIHTNVRAYLCEICGASFKTSSVQRKHVQTIHKNPRRFPCSKCQKRFNTKYSLRRHLSTHDTPGMRALQDTEAEMMTETEETPDVLEQFVQDDEDDDDDNVEHKIHIIQPQIMEVGSIVEQTAEGVMDTGQHVVIATTSEDLTGVQTIEQTYEHDVTDGSVQQTLLQPNEASTALYYLNFQPY